ncbi:hypothetical protein ACFLTA_09640 [Bacteroidota bacterium]
MILAKSKSAAWIYSLLITILYLCTPRLIICAQQYTYETQTIPLKGELHNFIVWLSYLSPTLNLRIIASTESKEYKIIEL